MVHHVSELSRDQRFAIESLLGRALQDQESVTIRPSVVVKKAPTGEERTRLVQQYKEHLDMLAERVKHVPEEELDAAIEEALNADRHE